MGKNKSKKPLKKSKMKFFGIINIAAVFADEMGSLLSGTELQDCGGQQCVNDSRAHGTLVCMQINDDVKSVWRSLANVENGSFKCMCVHAYNWVVQTEMLIFLLQLLELTNVLGSISRETSILLKQEHLLVQIALMDANNRLLHVHPFLI